MNNEFTTANLFRSPIFVKCAIGSIEQLAFKLGKTAAKLFLEQTETSGI
jgi:hypothetical protein